MANQASVEAVRAGETLGHYRILEQIGAGGMGVVYRAHDEHLNRDVAVKVLPPGLLRDDAARQRFHREALALSGLNQPNIATVHDFDTCNGIDYLVEELIPGVSLDEMLEGGPLREKECIDLGGQLCAGLAAAHELRVIHRDIKPANLRVTPEGHLKILDFGLAKTLAAPMSFPGEAPTLSETQAVVGTFPYMSPEQLTNEKLDVRTDIWSAGAVLYEMATGRRPFPGSGSQLVNSILNDPLVSPRAVNSKVSRGLEAIILKCLEKDWAQRYASAREIGVDLHRLASASSLAPRQVRRRQPKWLIWSSLILVVIAATAVLMLFHNRRAHPLTEQDTVVLGDFENTTGEQVFDDALKQALAVQLEQTPFLHLLASARVQQTLAMMGRPGHERLNEEVGREVCQRTQSKALLTGSVASLGTQYLLGVKALNCATGDILAQEQVQVAHKEEVLAALGELAIQLRRRLGESLATVQKFDTPVAEATTSSLEALRDYSLALQAWDEKGNAASIPFLQRAIELDPEFALAYAHLGNAYANLGQAQQAEQNISKAYALRSRVTELERLYIESHYYLHVTGELDKADQVFELWKTTYPRSLVPYVNRGSVYYLLGQYEKAAVEQREALRRLSNAVNYGNLADCYLRWNRLADAEQLLREARSRNLGGEFLLGTSYMAAFLRGDQEAMQRLVAEATGQGEAEHTLLAYQSEVEAYYGHLEKAREASRLAQQAAERVGDQEAALPYRIEAAVWEAELGDRERARQELAPVTPTATSRENAAIIALAWARMGDPIRARGMAHELAERYPKDTLIQYYWLPTIAAALALDQKNAPQALEILQTAAPYELADGGMRQSGWSAGYPIFLRGEAYLMSGNAPQAAAEFQKLLDHPGIIETAITGPLSYLGLARACVRAGQRERAAGAYESLLRLWRSADPGIPAYQQAKAEYASLQ